MVRAAARGFDLRARSGRLRFKTVMMMAVPFDEIPRPLERGKRVHIRRVSTTLYPRLPTHREADGLHALPGLAQTRQNFFTLAEHHNVSAELPQSSSRRCRTMRTDTH